MYSKTHWQDRVVDPETGEVVQEGTFMSAEHFNNMEDGIEANDTAISEISESVETIETTLDTEVGTTISLTVNSSTFVMKLALKNSEGNILSEAEVDLPIESMIVNAEYVEATKSLVLTLQSGSKVTVPLSALINGLVNDTRKVAGMDLKKDITVAEMVTALGVDKKVNKTSVSSGENSTTSVINVTDAKAQMAMVAKISGKTVKDGDTLKSAVVESVVSVGRNLIPEPWVSGGINSNTGADFNADPTYHRSEYFEVTGNTQFTFVNKNGKTASVYFYDGSKTYIPTRVATNNTVSVTSPANAKYARIEYTNAYGMEFKHDIALIKGTATDYSPYNKTTVLVPSAVKNLPDYGCSVGNIANEIDFENGVYYHRVKKIKLATLSWENPSDYQGHRRIAAANVKSGGSGTSTSLISNVYTADTSPVGNGSVDKTICFYNASLYVSDWSNQTDKATFVKHLQDTDAEIVYELASVETIPLTDFIRPLPVEQGGTLTLVNEHNLDVNSTIKYKKEV